jgi:hypothetical protein
MPRVIHGQAINREEVNDSDDSHDKPVSVALFDAAAAPANLLNFDFLFQELQIDSANLLPETPATRESLVVLGHTMRAVSGGASDDSAIPAAYTYFGQFVDHDLTSEELSAPLPKLINPELTPLSLEAIRATLRNRRTGALDLDSVYAAPAPRAGERMSLGKVAPTQGNQKRPAGKDDFNDLPREGRNTTDAAHDRAALIGDPRNDENLVIQQLHVAFLRAHNALVEQGHGFEAARTLMRQHYQHIVLRDFLPRIADPQIVKQVLQRPHAVAPFFMPLEFTAAAYRFGHGLVRAEYDFNVNFNASGALNTEPATLARLFSFTALSGQLGDFDTLPEHWIIEWERFVDVGQPFNRARRLAPSLVEPLFQLPNLRGIPEQGDGARLAVRNLLRGYLLRMPTGQAVANACGLPPLTPAEIEQAAVSDEQRQVLRDAGFLERTPLWFYVLAEAAVRASGQHLGPVGSTLVATVLIAAVRQSADSILRLAEWQPTLPGVRAHEFDLADLLRLAGVLASG